MIRITLKGKNIAISIVNSTRFRDIVMVLKRNYLRYNAKTYEWITSFLKYEELRTQLEELDTIESDITEDVINDLLLGEPEIEIEKQRRIADYTLLNYPPMQGKHPFENFQSQAINRGINKSRQAYFYGMGSGKSYIASAIIAHRYLKYKDCAKVIFLTTSIGVRNLYHELFKFIKDLDESRVCIADKDYRNPFDDKNNDIVIMSYNSFRLVCEYYKKAKKIKSKIPRNDFLPLKEWSEGKELMLVLDESHELSHITSQRSKYVLLHSEQFKYRYIFSGTPADNPEKLYTQYRILDPYLVYHLGINEWKEKMAYIGTRFSAYAIREWKREELEKLNKIFTASYGEYHSTDDLITLPEYYEKKIYIDMQKKHRELYEQVVMQRVPARSSVRDVINLFPFMALAIDDPHMLEKHEEKFDMRLESMIETFKDSYLEKFNAIDDILEDHPDEKGIIWAIHPSTIAKLSERYAKYNPICITGATEQSERFNLVNEFKTGDHKLLIANITCLNTSVTITEATFQIYVERSYNFSTYEQSTFRIYRAGQTQRVTSYILIYNKSLDVFLDKNLSSKGMLVDGLCNKDFLTQDQWATIFNATENDNINY